MIRPTTLLALMFALLVPISVLAGALLHWLLPFALLSALLLAFLLDAWLTRPAPVLDVVVPARVFIGTAINVMAELRAGTVELLVEAAGDIDPPLVVAGHGSVVMPLVPRRRGRVSVAAVRLRWRGPMGLNQRLHRVAVDKACDVVPDIRSVQTGALEFQDRDSPAGIKMQRDRGAGTEFDALRDFMPGMDIAAVDWKHSARHGRLVAREMRIERNHQIVLAYDTGLLMRAPIGGVPRLDHCIGAGLLLGWIALRGGDSVGTYGFDSRVRQWAPPVRGAGAFARLQQQAATLEYHTQETNFTLGLAELQARLRRRALVVLFTDFVDTVTAELMTERLSALGSRHVVVFVSLRDPQLQDLIDAPPETAAALGQAVVASDFLRERRIVFARLQRLGVHCLDVDRAGVSAGLINRYTAIKQRGLL